jgi:hypothetical protein
MESEVDTDSNVDTDSMDSDTYSDENESHWSLDDSSTDEELNTDLPGYPVLADILIAGYLE